MIVSRIWRALSMLLRAVPYISLYKSTGLHWESTGIDLDDFRPEFAQRFPAFIAKGEKQKNLWEINFIL